MSIKKNRFFIVNLFSFRQTKLYKKTKSPNKMLIKMNNKLLYKLAKNIYKVILLGVILIILKNISTFVVECG